MKVAQKALSLVYRDRQQKVHMLFKVWLEIKKVSKQRI